MTESFAEAKEREKRIIAEYDARRPGVRAKGGPAPRRSRESEAAMVRWREGPDQKELSL